MKGCLFFLLVSLLFSPSAFGELSAQDFEKLNGMFKESEARLRAEIAASEKRTREFVTQEIAKLTARMDERDRRIAAEFQGVNKRIDDTNNRLSLNLALLIALLGLIGVALGLPYLQDKKKERVQDEKIAAQQQQLEAQQKLLETQQQRIDAMEAELKTLKKNQMPSA